MSSLPWFRFYSEAVGDMKFNKIARTCGISKAEAFGAWAMILCAASESPERGKLYVTLQERYTVDDVADLIGFQKRKAQKYILALVRMDMIGCKCGVFFVVNWDKRQYTSDNSTERVKKYREKQEMKRSGNVTVTPPEVRGQNTDTDTDDRRQKEEDAAFDLFQLTCEKNGILANTPGDEKTLLALVKGGAILDDLAAGIVWKVDNSSGKALHASQLLGPTQTAMSKRLQPPKNGTRQRSGELTEAEKLAEQRKAVYGKH